MNEIKTIVMFVLVMALAVAFNAVVKLESRVSKLEHNQHNQTNTVRFVTSFDDK